MNRVLIQKPVGDGYEEKSVTHTWIAAEVLHKNGKRKEKRRKIDQTGRQAYIKSCVMQTFGGKNRD